MAFCTKCGAEIADGSKFCIKCGTPVAEQSAPVAVEAPVVEQPVPVVVETPVVEAPVMEQPVSVAAVETPVAEAPVMEQPVPVVETPVMEQPMVTPVPEVQPMAQPAYGMPAMNQTPVEPKKKSKLGLIIGLSVGGVVLLAAIIVTIVLIIANSADTVDLKKYVKAEYEGYDEYGKAYITLDKTSLIKGIIEAQGKDPNKVSVNDVNQNVIALLSNMTLDNDQFEDVKNGQELTVTVIYDKKLMEESKLEFENDKITLKVEGLEPLQDVDPFDYIKINFSGTAPDGYVYASFDSDIDCVDWASCEIDKDEDLNNGDKITVTITEDSIKYAAQTGYKFTETSKEYTVEGLAYYMTSLKDVTDDFLDKYKEIAEKEIKDDYKWDADYGTLSDMKYAGMYFAKDKSDDESDNELYIIYTATLTSTRGDFAPTQIVLPVQFSSLYVDNEGKLSKYLYGSLKGTIDVEGQYYSFSGYVTGNDFYKDIIDANSSDYDFEASKELPDYSVESAPVEQPTQATEETSAPADAADSVDSELETEAEVEPAA